MRPTRSGMWSGVRSGSWASEEVRERYVDAEAWGEDVGKAGCSHKRTKKTRHGHDGNTILVNLGKATYIQLGATVETIPFKKPVESYWSPVSNKGDVPQPPIVGKRVVCFADAEDVQEVDKKWFQKDMCGVMHPCIILVYVMGCLRKNENIVEWRRLSTLQLCETVSRTYFIFGATAAAHQHKRTCSQPSRPATLSLHERGGAVVVVVVVVTPPPPPPPPLRQPPLTWTHE